MTDVGAAPAPTDRRRVGRTTVGLVLALVAGLAAAHWLDLDGQRRLVELFPDPALAACVADALDEESAQESVSRGALVGLRTLTCPPSVSAGLAAAGPASATGAPIRSLAGLERLEQLASLSLAEQEIVDLAPLAGLSSLGDVRLTGNLVADLAPLSGLPSLTELGLAGNRVDDLSPLSSVPTLRALGVGRNRVSDLSPLAGLPLTYLDVHGNQVTDLGPLSGLAELGELVLTYNRITDAGPLAGLGSLRELELSRNQVRDVSPLRALPALRELWLGGNPVADVSTLVGAPELVGVDLEESLPPAGVEQLRASGVFVGGLA